MHRYARHVNLFTEHVILKNKQAARIPNPFFNIFLSTMNTPNPADHKEQKKREKQRLEKEKKEQKEREKKENEMKKKFKVRGVICFEMMTFDFSFLWLLFIQLF